MRSAPSKPSRIPSLDAARALGVVAMVVGHTLDALVALSVREEPLLVAYWKARGFTAPVFMMAAGWAVTVSISRGSARGLAIARGRLPRVALLLAIAYALRWPGWGAERLGAWDPEVWAHLLAFDALHSIALSLLAAALVFGLSWSAREKAAAFALLAALSVSLGMGGTAPLLPHPATLPPPPFAMALAQAAGGSSTFPLFPWAAYFFAGAVVGLAAGDVSGRRAAALGAVGAALVAATCWTGVGAMPPAHPVLFVYRVGAVLLLFAALSAVPAGLARAIAPLGRASLGVYAIHVPVVYGWSTRQGLAQRVGPALEPLEALGVAVAVLVGSVALHHALVAIAAAAAGAARAARELFVEALAAGAAGRDGGAD